MFGPTIDYYLLKPFTHKDNIKTEEELDLEAEVSTVVLDPDKKYLQRLQIYYKDQIPLDPNLSYLDIGSGIGRLSFDLILAGARDVTGVDNVERYII